MHMVFCHYVHYVIVVLLRLVLEVHCKKSRMLWCLCWTLIWILFTTMQLEILP